MLKLLIVVGGPVLLILFVLRNHPALAMGFIYVVCLGGLVASIGHQRYMLKKSEWESRRRRELLEGMPRQAQKWTDSRNGHGG